MIPPALIAGVLELTRHVSLNRRAHELAVELVCALCIAGATIVVSGAIDWYVILPQLAGYIGRPPCQSSFRPKWKWVTISWYLHRIVAALATIGGPIATAIIISTYLLGHIDEFVAGEAIALAGLVAATYKFRIPTAVTLMLNPQVHVGDAVKYATFFTRTPVEGYVVDVSLEAVKVKNLSVIVDSDAVSTELLVSAVSNEPWPSAGPAIDTLQAQFGSRKESVAIPINRIEDYLQREPTPFAQCANGCCGINWYCKYNPQAS